MRAARAGEYRAVKDLLANLVLRDDLRHRDLRLLEWMLAEDEGHLVPEPIDSKPVFLLSAGWRTGSTLVQRLLTSPKKCLIWGEPFGDLGVTTRLALTVARLGPPSPYRNLTLSNFGTELTSEFIANLNPTVPDVRNAHRAMHEELFAKTAKAAGYERWGAKWVRLDGFHAIYLKWVYPGCRLVFLVRHPLACWKSYQGKQWYLIRSDRAVTGRLRFFAHWRHLASSFFSVRQRLGALMVRYEDLLTAPERVSELSRHVCLDLNLGALASVVGSSGERGAVSLIDTIACSIMAGDVSKRLGYRVGKASADGGVASSG